MSPRTFKAISILGKTCFSQKHILQIFQKRFACKFLYDASKHKRTWTVITPCCTCHSVHLCFKIRLTSVTRPQIEPFNRIYHTSLHCKHFTYCHIRKMLRRILHIFREKLHKLVVKTKKSILYRKPYCYAYKTFGYGVHSMLIVLMKRSIISFCKNFISTSHNKRMGAKIVLIKYL